MLFEMDPELMPLVMAPLVVVTLAFMTWYAVKV